MPADTPDQPTDSGVEAVAHQVSDDQDGPAELGDRFCSRPDCEFAEQQHMHIEHLPHGWSLATGDAVPVVLDTPDDAA